MNRTVLIMAGGTGGHVFPALALARQLRTEGWQVVWLGTSGGIEARVVPEQGFLLETINVGGVRGKGALSAWMAPWRVLRACFRSIGVFMQHHPHVVVGFGGFASFPGGLAAAFLMRPLVVHEQNAVAGLTNRLLAPFASRVLAGFPAAFQARSTHPVSRWWPAPRRVSWVGNPVRADIAGLPSPQDRFAGREGVLELLVLGGSQGAQALNRLIPAALALIPVAVRPRVVHQGGQRWLDELRDHYRHHEVEADLRPFIEDMADAYARCDLVICRSGALTVAELAAAGVGSILVPFPAAVDDHQTKNAEFLEQNGAARVMPQATLDPVRLASWLQETTRPALLSMATAARALARPEATEAVAGVCRELAA